MSTLGLSLRERVWSRLVFYTLVFAGMGAINRVLPEPGEVEAAKWEKLGVARPFFAVPIEDVERYLVRQSR